MLQKRMSYFLKSFYFFCIVLMAFYCFKRPFNNWDRLPYSALVLKMDHHNAKEAHDLAYKLAKENKPSEYYRKLTDSTNEYKHTMLKDSKDFKSSCHFM